MEELVDEFKGSTSETPLPNTWLDACWGPTHDGRRQHSLDERQRAVVGFLRDVYHLVPQPVFMEDGLQSF